MTVDNIEKARAAAKALYQRGRYEQALARYGEVIALDPTDASAWAHVASCRSYLDDAAGSLEAADELVRLEPESYKGHSYRAFALGDLNRYPEAIDAAREAVRLAPDDGRQWSSLAQQLRCAGRVSEATDAAERACELDPTDPDAWDELGRCALAADNFAAADRALRRALELDPLFVEGHDQMVRSLISQRRHQEAAEHARTALSLDWSRKPWAMRSLVNRLATSLAATGRLDDGCDLLRTAIAAQPTNPGFRTRLIDVLLNADRREEAHQVAREAVAALPDSASSWAGLAQALGEVDPSALAAARRATELDPTSAWAWHLYGLCLRASGDLRGAAEAMRRGADAQPGSEFEQGRACDQLRALGEAASALAFADRAVTLAPQAAGPHRRRSLALLALGRVAEAHAEARTASDLAPTYLLSWQHRTEIAFLAGDVADAQFAAAEAGRLAADAAATGNDEDREAAHLAAEAAAFAAWARGDLAAARSAFATAVDTDHSCCCSRLGGLLIADPPASPAEVDALMVPVTDFDSDHCSSLDCWLRRRATAAVIHG